MNKLLDELSQKAEDYADDTDLPWLATYTERLAQLIVKECIKCCDEIDDINKHYREKMYIDPEFGPKECIEIITEHFGVK